MENLSISVLVLDHDAVSMSIISSSLAKFNFKEAALYSLESGVAKGEELDLVLAEVHLANITVATAALFDHILSKLEVPLITMCAYDNEDVVSEPMFIGPFLHVVKPLDVETFNILKKKALEHRSARHETIRRIDSSSNKEPKRRLETSNADRSETEEERLEVWKAPGYSERSIRFVWTTVLHEKFLQAVEVLGERATAGQIRRQMNIMDVTSKQISSHLQKHRKREQRMEQRRDQLNTSMKRVPELSAHNAATPENINLLTITQILTTPRIALATRKAHPRFETIAEKKSLEAATSKPCARTAAIFGDNTNSVWDRYQKTVQYQEIMQKSSYRKRLPVKSGTATKDGHMAYRPMHVDGGMGYGAAGSAPLGNTSSSIFTSFLHQLGENRCADAAANNGNLDNITLNKDTVKNAPVAAAMADDMVGPGNNDLPAVAQNQPTAEMGLPDPFPPGKEVESFWMAQLQEPQAHQEPSPEDLLQVNNAWIQALQPVVAVGVLPEMDGAPTAQEPPPVIDAPANDTAHQFSVDDILWPWSPLVAGEYVAPNHYEGN